MYNEYGNFVTDTTAVPKYSFTAQTPICRYCVFYQSQVADLEAKLRSAEDELATYRPKPISEEEQIKDFAKHLGYYVMIVGETYGN